MENFNLDKIAGSMSAAIDTEFWRYYVHLMDNLIESVKKDLGYTVLTYEKMREAQGKIAGIEMVKRIPEKIKKNLEESKK